MMVQLGRLMLPAGLLFVGLTEGLEVDFDAVSGEGSVEDLHGGSPPHQAWRLE